MATITKRSLIAVTLIFFAAAGAFASGASEADLSGRTVAEAVPVESFTDVYVSGITNLNVTQGDKTSVIIKGDTALIDAVDVSSADGYLSIVADSRDALDLEVEIITPDLAALMLGNGTEATLSAWEMDSDLSIVLSDGAGLATEGTLAAGNVAIINQRAAGADLAIDAEAVSVESNDGSITLTGSVADAVAYLTLDGTLVMDGLAVQNVDAALYNDGSLEATLPGISTVEVITNQDASANFEMNGTIRATAGGDSSISATGDITRHGIYEGTDASISIG